MTWILLSFYLTSSLVFAFIAWAVADPYKHFSRWYDLWQVVLVFLFWPLILFWFVVVAFWYHFFPPGD